MLYAKKVFIKRQLICGHWLGTPSRIPAPRTGFPIDNMVFPIGSFYNRIDKAFEKLNQWIETNDKKSDVLDIEYIKLLIDIGKQNEALQQTKHLLGNLHSTLTRHYCSQCGYNSDEIFWRCPQCHKWETIQFRWKV